jgi:hypothetical protein
MKATRDDLNCVCVLLTIYEQAAPRNDPPNLSYLSRSTLFNCDSIPPSGRLNIGLAVWGLK